MYAEVAVRPPDVSSYAHNSLPAPSSSRSPIAGTGTTPVDSTTVNMSAPGPSIQPTRSASLSPASSLPSFDTTITPTPLLVAKADAPSGAATGVELNTTASAPQQDAEPDAQIVEALRSKDRIYVLKLGEQMEALIKDRRVRIELSPSTSYQRLLVHRCSAYYRLSPEADPVTKSIMVYCRSESRIPTRRICELVPAEQATQPTIQIMRRPRGRQYSQPGSTAGEDADTSDVDASEAGSIGSRSNTASAAAKRFKTIEEREAAYNEARSRIFMDFEEKEKEKEKDMSANSSTFSLVSGSGSTSGGRGSSIGDLDDSASSAPTESEWSGPVARDKRDVRKGAGSATSSSRSLRSSAPSFNNGSNSSRNSRATSPSFTYPTLYDPAVPPVYEQTQYGPQIPPPAGYIPHYGYPQYNPAPPGQPYVGPYYYPPYNYPPPPTQHSDPGTPGGVEYPPLNPPQQPAYPQYMWPNSPPPGQAPVANQYAHQQPGLNAPRPDALPSAHAMPPTQNIPQYPPYAPAPPVYGYGMPYYPQPYQPGAPMGPPPSLPGPAYPTGPIPESVSGSVGSPNGLDMPNLSRTSSRNSNGHGSVNGRRGAPRGRGSWMHGPGGVSNGSYGYGSPPVHGMGGHETFGTRLGVNARRISGTSSSSGSAGARTPADETSSTASSSTTSSSSRRTFTSTSTSSKHPLPARPDWAVGLKPQHPRHHDHHGTAASHTLSPSRMGQPHHSPQPVLQATDFPPLSSGPSTRQPVVGGAWTNASTSRVMKPGPQGSSGGGGGAPQGTALVHYPNSQQTSPQIPASAGRFEEQDPARGVGPGPGVLRLENGWAKTNGEGAAAVVAGLADKLGGMGLEGGDVNGVLPSDGGVHPSVSSDAAVGSAAGAYADQPAVGVPSS